MINDSWRHIANVSFSIPILTPHTMLILVLHLAPMPLVLPLLLRLMHGNPPPWSKIHSRLPLLCGRSVGKSRHNVLHYELNQPVRCIFYILIARDALVYQHIYVFFKIKSQIMDPPTHLSMFRTP